MGVSIRFMTPDSSSFEVALCATDDVSHIEKKVMTMNWVIEIEDTTIIVHIIVFPYTFALLPRKTIVECRRIAAISW